MSKINAKRIREIFLDTLFRSEELPPTGIPESCILCEGVTTKVGFHPGRLESHKQEISDFIDHWNPNLKNGCSFLVLCLDETLNQWGEQANVQELMLLGMAIGRLEYVFPRELWPALPGGVPYIMVKENNRSKQ